MPEPWMRAARWPACTFQNGPEGNWSTFPLSAGSPKQDFDVLISTHLSHLSLPFADYCAQNPSPGCGSRRGARPFLGKPSDGFSPAQSSSWLVANTSDLAHGGRSDDGDEAVERVKIEVAQPEHQLMGMLGLRALPNSDWVGSRFVGPTDSLIQQILADTRVSYSFGYTAGAAYRNADASLIFGGYDASRLGRNAHSFPFSVDTNNPLIVRLANITMSEGFEQYTSSSEPFLESVTQVLLDSTSPYYVLPEATCKTFQRAFGLEYEPDSGLFLVNESTSQLLRNSKATVQFKFVEEYEADGGVEVHLPFTSFDLQIRRTLEGREVAQYFPLKVVTGNEMSVLGRAFFQEAYLIVDYERENFTLAQCHFPPPGAQLQNATIIDWYRGGTAGLGMTVLLVAVFLLAALVSVIILCQVPNFLLYHLVEVPRTRGIRRREKQLESLWKEIHTSKETLHQNFHATDDSFHSYTRTPLPIEENGSSAAAITQARVGKRRAGSMQILR